MCIEYFEELEYLHYLNFLLKDELYNQGVLNSYSGYGLNLNRRRLNIKKGAV
jgi:hypothetical protein